MSNKFIYNPAHPLQSALAQSFLHYHPEVSAEEAHEAWLELREVGVNLDNLETAYVALHNYFSGAGDATGGRIDGTKVELSPLQRKIAKDIGCDERSYARGYYEHMKSKGKV